MMTLKKIGFSLGVLSIVGVGTLVNATGVEPKIVTDNQAETQAVEVKEAARSEKDIDYSGSPEKVVDEPKVLSPGIGSEEIDSNFSTPSVK